jgi:hypothetical protein
MADDALEAVPVALDAPLFGDVDQAQQSFARLGVGLVEQRDRKPEGGRGVGFGPDEVVPIRNPQVVVGPGAIGLEAVLLARGLEETAPAALRGGPGQIEGLPRRGVGVADVAVVPDDDVAVGGVFDDGVEARALREQSAIAANAHDRLHAQAQLGAGVGLGDEVVRAGGNALQPRVAVIERGNQQHRNFGRERVGTEAATDFKAVHAGHHDIEHDQVGQHLRNHLQCFLAANPEAAIDGSLSATLLPAEWRSEPGLEVVHEAGPNLVFPRRVRFRGFVIHG